MRQRTRRTQRGMTLVEVLISTGLLVGGGGAILAGMYQGLIFVDYMNDQQVAMNAVQGKLEELSALSFTELGTQYAAAYTPAGMRVCAGEDANCNGVLDNGEVDVNRNGRADRLMSGVNGSPAGTLHIRISTTKGEAKEDATLLDVHVAASWVTRGRCIGGEDRNCNSLLDTSPTNEDRNANGWLDAPVMASTRLAIKN